MSFTAGRLTLKQAMDGIGALIDQKLITNMPLFRALWLPVPRCAICKKPVKRMRGVGIFIPGPRDVALCGGAVPYVMHGKCSTVDGWPGKAEETICALAWQLTGVGG